MNVYGWIANLMVDLTSYPYDRLEGIYLAIMHCTCEKNPKMK